MSINSYQKIVADVLGLKFDDNTDVISFCSQVCEAMQSRKDNLLGIAEEIKKIEGRGGSTSNDIMDIIDELRKYAKLADLKDSELMAKLDEVKASVEQEREGFEIFNR